MKYRHTHSVDHPPLPPQVPQSIPGFMLNYLQLNRHSVVSLPLSCYPSVPPGNTNSVFALDYISGSLTVNGQLDRENPLYSAGFTLTVKVGFFTFITRVL